MSHLAGTLSFIETASLGSYTKAALKLDVSTAAVSKNVQRLEADLGVRLLNRSTRKISMTPEGEAYLEQAREALRLLDEAAAQAGQARREAVGKVRLSSAAAFGRNYVLPALPDLLEKHPQLEVEVSLDNRAVDLVAEGFDLGLRGGVIKDSALIARRVCALPTVLLASPGYLKRRGVPLKPTDLQAHEALGVRFASGVVGEWRFGKGKRATSFAPPARLWVSDPESLMDLVLAGHGIAQMGFHHALPYLRTGKLKVVLLGQSDPGERQVVLQYPHRQFLAPRVRVVIDALMAHFAELDVLQAPLNEARQFSASA
jgi:DNA-binding transcriptional LysR family regulator